MSYVFDILNRSITESAEWFLTLLGGTGMTNFYLSMVFLALLGKFILRPLFGSGRGSDIVKKKSGNSGGNADG